MHLRALQESGVDCVPSDYRYLLELLDDDEYDCLREAELEGDDQSVAPKEQELLNSLKKAQLLLLSLFARVLSKF